MINKSEVSLRDLRIFGLIWGLIAAVVAFKSGHVVAVFLSLIFFAVAVFFPKFYLYSGFYKAWIRFGNVLGKANGFVISFILFYAIFTPVGICLRLFKKDLLFKKLDPAATSYFIDRKVQPNDMKRQF